MQDKIIILKAKSTFTNHAFGIRLTTCSILVINQKNDNDVTISRKVVIAEIFWRCRVSSVMFSYWSKFHVNMIIGSRVMTIFLYKRLTKKPEIGNTPVWVLLNIGRQEWVRDTELAKMSLRNCYWMLQNATVTAVTVSELLREICQECLLPLLD